MRTLEDLGISPAPWEVDDGRVWNSDGWLVYDAPYHMECAMPYQTSNARLIAAAPDLYRALREAVIRSCDECAETNIEGCRGNCYVANWREVLEKAAGEEAK